SYAPGEYIYLLLYVDDMMIACKSKDGIGSTKYLLKKEFVMKELGEAKKILGMEINRQSEINSDAIGWALQAIIEGLLGFVDSDYVKDPNKEAEYMALTEAVKEAIWLKGLAVESGFELKIVAGIPTGALLKAILV
ncbi:retrotransposon protein, putative, ty1-copia subclass, partial [Tanacetum coccineum]